MSEIETAFIGMVGGIAGSIITMLGNYIVSRTQIATEKEKEVKAAIREVYSPLAYITSRPSLRNRSKAFSKEFPKDQPLEKLISESKEVLMPFIHKFEREFDEIESIVKHNMGVIKPHWLLADIQFYLLFIDTCVTQWNILLNKETTTTTMALSKSLLSMNKYIDKLDDCRKKLSQQFLIKCQLKEQKEYERVFDEATLTSFEAVLNSL